MTTRTIYLVSFRQAAQTCAHFAIFVPLATDPSTGTLIHVVGAPMAGYQLEFKRNYRPDDTRQRFTVAAIGQVQASKIVATVPQGRVNDTTSHGNLEIAASQVRPPGISENFMAPVNDTTNKRCQEWTMEYVCYLVEKGYIEREAIEIVQSQRDPPSHGIGLKKVGDR